METEATNVATEMEQEIDNGNTTRIEPEPEHAETKSKPTNKVKDQNYWDQILKMNNINQKSTDTIIQTYKAYIYSNAQHHEQPVGFKVNSDEGYEYYIFNQNGESTAFEILENKEPEDVEFLQEKYKGNETDTSKSSGEISFKNFKKPKVLKKIKDRVLNTFSKSNDSLNSIDQLYEEQISQLQEKIKNYQTTVNKQNSEIDKTKAELKTNEEIISEKTAEIEALQIKIEKDTFNYETDLHNLSENIAEKIQNLEKLEQLNSQLSAKNWELEEKITKEASEYENAIQELKQNIYILNKENKELSDTSGNEKTKKKILIHKEKKNRKIKS